jgi:hypothetical protein
MEINIGGYKAKSQEAQSFDHWNVALWGASSSGKTTLANTMPGDKLWLVFDPNGLSSINIGEHDLAIDFSSADYTVTAKMDNKDPLDIGKFLDSQPNIKTVILDSVTTLSDLALLRAVAESKSSTIQTPGMHGYAWRNTIVLSILKKFIALLNPRKINFVIILHEGKADKDELTQRIFMSFLAGGELPNLIPIRFDEIWYLEDTGKERRIYIRSNMNRKPMKSRLFDTTKSDFFVWKYDANTDSGHKIKDWFEKRKASASKLPLPT